MKRIALAISVVVIIFASQSRAGDPTSERLKDGAQHGVIKPNYKMGRSSDDLRSLQDKPVKARDNAIGGQASANPTKPENVFKSSVVPMQRPAVNITESDRQAVQAYIHGEFSTERSGITVLPPVAREEHKPWAKYTSPGPIVEQSAILASDVYDASKAVKKNGHWVIVDGKQEKSYEPPAGYTLKAARTGENGFGAAVYENNKTGERTFAISGTKDLSDYIADVEIIAKTHPKGGTTIVERLVDASRTSPIPALGYFDSQVKQTLQFYEEAKQLPPSYPFQSSASRTENLHVTGHSLGGALAQIVGAKYQVETHTFNAVGVPEESIQNYVGTIRSSVPITNHIRREDLVGNYGSHIGATVTYSNHDPGGERGLFATPSLSDATGKVKEVLFDNHSVDSFPGSLREGERGHLATDRGLEVQRAKQAVQQDGSTSEAGNSSSHKLSAKELGFLSPSNNILMSNPLCPKE